METTVMMEKSLAGLFDELKIQLKGTWKGEGFAKFPTIDNTAYTEEWSFEPDHDKAAIYFNQKTWYKNETPNNGQTVFWDTGFIIYKEEKIILVSVQVGSRLESYDLSEVDSNTLVFNSQTIVNDPKTIRSQRIIHLSDQTLEYELNMSTKQADQFQNHLIGSLYKVSS